MSLRIVLGLFLIAMSGATPSRTTSAPSVAGTLGQVFMGPLGNGRSAFTSVQITNQDAVNDCEATILFHQGAVPTSPEPLINGRRRRSAAVNIPSGGIAGFELTADELIEGIATILVSAPCNANSLSLSGTYFIGALDRPEGGLDEAFSIRPNTESTLLRPGRCRPVPVQQGPAAGDINQNLGIALSSIFPGQPAPPDTELDMMFFDRGGAFVQNILLSPGGEHSTFFPSEILPGLTGAGTLVFCLNGPDPDYAMDLSAVRVNRRGGFFQFDQAIFADGFESGDVSAWSR